MTVLSIVPLRLQSYIPPDEDAAMSAKLEDCRLIYVSPSRRLTPALMRALFRRNVSFIEKAVGEALARGLKPVVLTHHAPSFYRYSLSLSVYLDVISEKIF